MAVGVGKMFSPIFRRYSIEHLHLLLQNNMLFVKSVFVNSPPRFTAYSIRV
jgi:hypothetical protein